MEKKIKVLYEQYCEILAMIQAQRMNFIHIIFNQSFLLSLNIILKLLFPKLF